MRQKLKNIKQQIRNVYWWIYGNTLRNPRLPDNPGSLLFVCKGNICRSPFAERLAANIAHNKSYAVHSAGLEVSQPLPPPENAILAAAKFGVELGGHKSRKINQQMMDSADMVLVMEPWHRRSLLETFSYRQDIQKKVFLLPLFQNQGAEIEEAYDRYNISDPYGKSVSQFQRCFRDIEKCLSGLLMKIAS